MGTFYMGSEEFIDVTEEARKYQLDYSGYIAFSKNAWDYFSDGQPVSEVRNELKLLFMELHNKLITINNPNMNFLYSTDAVIRSTKQPFWVTKHTEAGGEILTIMLAEEQKYLHSVAKSLDNKE